MVGIHDVNLSALLNSETSDTVLNQSVGGMADGVAYFAHPKTASHASGMRLVSWQADH